VSQKGSSRWCVGREVSERREERDAERAGVVWYGYRDGEIEVVEVVTETKSGNLGLQVAEADGAVVQEAIGWVQ